MDPGLQFLVYLSTLRCLVTNSYKIEWQELPFVSLALYTTYPHPIDQLAILLATHSSIRNRNIHWQCSKDAIVVCYRIYIYIVFDKTSRQTIFLCLTLVFYYWTPRFLLINYLFLLSCVTRQFLPLSIYLNGNLNGCDLSIEELISLRNHELHAKWSILQENLCNNLYHSKLLLFKNFTYIV